MYMCIYLQITPPLMHEDSIQVYVRVRPSDDGDALQFDAKEIRLEKHRFRFDRVFGVDSTQQEIFNSVGARLIQGTLEGYNGSVFVYGQTGSGKTHTMTGDQNGLMQRCFQQLFQRVDCLDAECLITCSYFQLYNEQIIDLLDPRKDRHLLNIRQDARKGVFVENLTEETALSADKLLECLAVGLRNRHVGQTLMNRQSSRSHSVFTIALSCKVEQAGGKVLKTPKLHFVDLAGSERQKSTLATGERLKEAGIINRSLTTLGMVINALASDKAHIPYRDSKLTCLLRDSLGGNSRTFLIATVSPSPLSFQQTLSTLSFAHRAKMVKLKALVNEESLTNNIQYYKDQIRRLKEEIRKLRAVTPMGKQSVRSNHLQQYFGRVNYTRTPQSHRPSIEEQQQLSEYLCSNTQLLTQMHSQLTEIQQVLPPQFKSTPNDEQLKVQSQHLVREKEEAVRRCQKLETALEREKRETEASKHELQIQAQTNQYNCRLLQEYSDKLVQYKGELASSRQQMHSMECNYDNNMRESEKIRETLILTASRLQAEVQRLSSQNKQDNCKYALFAEIANQRQREANERVEQMAEQLRSALGIVECNRQQSAKEIEDMKQEQNRQRETMERSRETMEEENKYLRGREEQIMNVIRDRQEELKVEKQGVMRMEKRMQQINREMIKLKETVVGQNNQMEILRETLFINKQAVDSYNTLHSSYVQLQQSHSEMSKLYREINTVHLSVVEQNRQLKQLCASLNHKQKEQQRVYEELLKRNYALRDESGRKAYTSAELETKVSFYEQKFNMMSIEYNNATQAVKKLKQRELNLKREVNEMKQLQKNKQMSRHIAQQGSEVEMLRCENAELKKQNKCQYESQEERIRAVLLKVIRKDKQNNNNSNEGKNTVGLDQLLQEWEKNQADVQAKWEAAMQALSKEQRLKAETNFILQENIYLRQQLEKCQKEEGGRGRKRVKPNSSVSKNSMQREK